MLDSDVNVNRMAQSQAEAPELEDQGLEALARRLERSGAYKVLRRLVPAPFSSEPVRPNERIGLVLDVETLGLDPVKDEVIELGMVKFVYSEKDEVTRVLGEFKAFQQPSVPIPPEITELTGITDAMVAGQAINGALVEAFVADANIVIAHNAIRPANRRAAMACIRAQALGLLGHPDRLEAARRRGGEAWLHSVRVRIFP